MDEPVAGTVMVIAKVPVPTRVKTRLTPPLSPEEACAVAWACLLDTLDVVATANVERRVLVLEGPAGSWIPDGFVVIEQRGGGLADRLAAAFADVDGPAVVIAMDTPQVRAHQLERALALLGQGHDAVLGPATDGGYWLIGLRGGIDPADVFAGIPMSVPHTAAAQRERLQLLGLRAVEVETLTDVDRVEDVVSVADALTGSRVAQVADRVVGAPHRVGGQLPTTS